VEKNAAGYKMWIGARGNPDLSPSLRDPRGAPDAIRGDEAGRSKLDPVDRREKILDCFAAERGSQ